MAKFIAAIDQGTTSTRCIVFDHSGSVISSEQKEHRQIYPQAGWVEHDAEEIWACTQSVVDGALRAGSVSPADIAAVGITNQRETIVAWDRRTGRPLNNAIVWQDTRTDEICRELTRSGGQDRFRSTTGLPVSTYFSGPKIRWLLENVPDLRRRADDGEALFGTIDSWIIWKLTGEHFTDVTNASRTLLMNLHSLDWQDELLSLFGIPRVVLPRIGASSGRIALMQANGALAGTIIAGDLGDQQAALFGQGCYEPGEAKSTYGTGCFLLLNTGETATESGTGLLTTLAYKLGSAKPVYALEGSIAIAGALVQWLRDNLGIIESSAEVETLAASVKDNGGIYFVPAFSGLFAPHWRADARGAILGMTRYVNKGHLARAALEATAFQTREVLEAMEADSGVSLRTLKADGGMVFNDVLMQFQADLLGVPVIRPAVTETTALGAAYAAGLAVGYWSSLDELRANWKTGKIWKPEGPTDRMETLYHEWKKALSRTLNWIE